jgi:hypothetical protein
LQGGRSEGKSGWSRASERKAITRARPLITGPDEKWPYAPLLGLLENRGENTPSYFQYCLPDAKHRETTARVRTDKKENKIFLIYKEIQSGAVARSYMTKGLFIYGEIFAHFLIY